MKHTRTLGQLAAAFVGAGLTTIGLTNWIASGTEGRAMTATGPQWVEGIVEALEYRAHTPTLRVVTQEGRTWSLAADANATSVFQDGAVLNLAHLRLGQWVRIRFVGVVGGAVRDAAAQSIEIVETSSPPKSVALPARSPQVNYTFQTWSDRSTDKWKYRTDPPALLKVY